MSFFSPRLFPILLATLSLLGFYIYLQHALIKPKYIFTPDDYGYVQYAAHYLVNDSKKSVLVLGGSTSREAFLPSEMMQQLFRDKLHKNWHFWNLSSSSQTLLESLALLNTVKLQPGSLLILGINVFRLQKNLSELEIQYQSPRLPFLDYKYAGLFLRTYHPTIQAIPHWKQKNLWIKKVIAELLKPFENHLTFSDYVLESIKFIYHLTLTGIQSDHYNSYLYLHNKRMSTADKIKFINKLSPAYQNYSHTREINLALLATILELAKAKKLNMIILHLPHDPLVNKAALVAERQFNKDIETFASEDIWVANYAKKKPFSSDDFYDLYHFMPKGREKFSYLFIEDLYQHLHKG